jgi:hypothetical protein
MSTVRPTAVRPSHRHDRSPASREQLLSEFFLFAGPAAAFVAAVVFSR